MDQKQFDELSEKIGTEAAAKIQGGLKAVETALNEKHAEAVKGLIPKAEFETFKNEQTAKAQELLATIEKLEGVTKEQGNLIKTMEKQAAPGSKSIEDFLVDQKDIIKQLRQDGKAVEFTASQMKAAGVTSITGSVTNMDTPPGSPYAPGIGSGVLDFFGIARNPNYIINQVDLGRTNQSRLAWINETGEQGTPTEVDEGNLKPLLDNSFKVEMSVAKKIAGYYEITDEFEEDLPQLATMVRRMLQERILRAWDDVIQTAVLAAARGYSLPGIAGQVPFANFWDAIYAMEANVRVNNFIPNTVGINPQTNVMMQTDKNSNGTYLLPPFKDEIQNMLVQANKVPTFNAFVGDLKQFKVDIYKEFTIKIGWINDNFVKNKFCILGEQRYHRYISDNRRNAIISANLSNVRATIDGGSGS